MCCGNTCKCDEQHYICTNKNAKPEKDLSYYKYCESDFVLFDLYPVNITGTLSDRIATCLGNKWCHNGTGFLFPQPFVVRNEKI